MARADRKVITLQSHVDNAPVIDGVNLGLKEDGTPKNVKIPVADYPGLFLQCLATKPINGKFDFTRSWGFRCTVKEGGELREVFRGLGSADSVILAAARKAADALRHELASGGTVQGTRAERASLKLQQATTPTVKEVAPQTFAWCAERFIEQARTRWATKDDSTEKFWRSALTRYVFPTIGNILVGEVTRTHVLQIILPLWTEKRPTAERVHPMIREVIDWAVTWGHAPEQPNPASWERLEKGLVDQTAKEVKHHPALHLTHKDGTNDYTPVQELVAKLRSEENVTHLALEFILLTGVRMSEARFAQWSEFDLDAKVWTVPAERMKGKKGKRNSHVVPLSDRVIEILRTLEGYRSRRYPHVVFPSQGAGIHFKEFMGESNLVRVLKRHLHRDGVDPKKLPDVHGFRSSLRDWAEDNDFDPTVAEFALAHAVGNKVENTYRRTKLVDKRRALMNAWAAFCSGQPGEPKTEGDNVVQLRAVA